MKVERSPAAFIRARSSAAKILRSLGFSDMWDVLKWQNDTLSIAWWALVAFAVLVIIAAGSRTTRK